MWIIVVAVVVAIVVMILRSSKTDNASAEVEGPVSPRPSGSFDDEFVWLCSFLGSRYTALRATLGEHDDADRAWVWFKSVQTSFGVDADNGRVFGLHVPTIDAFGHSLTGDTDNYCVHGVRPGMSKVQVAEVWGEPTNGTRDHSGWRYDNKAVRTRSGGLAVPILHFGVESERLDFFEARLID